jgi:hypothetical protein
MAFELAIVTVLAGIALGLRFKVLIPVPAVAFATAFTMIVGIARADQIGSIVWIIVIVGTAIQLGYLVGIATAARPQPAWRQ